MKFKLLFSILIYSCFISCRKDPPIYNYPNEEDKAIGETLPFENSLLKLELINATSPKELKEIQFITQNIGYALNSAQHNKIYKTTDGGQTWDLKYTPTESNFPLAYFEFPNPDLGICVGGMTDCQWANCVNPGGIILRTTDGGQTWVRITCPVFAPLHSVSMLDSIHFVAVGSRTFYTNNNTEYHSTGYIIKSDDAGLNWTFVDSLSNDVNDVYHNNTSFFLASYNGKELFKSTDFGNTWSSVSISLPAHLADIAFMNDTAICSDLFSIYKSFDEGISWDTMYSSSMVVGDINIISSMKTVGTGDSYTVNYDVMQSHGGVCITNDAGATWTEYRIFGVGGFTPTNFFDSNHAYLVDGAGNFLLLTIK